jgi:RIO kinase 1
LSDTPRPSWLHDHGCADAELGVLRSGKEAQIDLIERSAPDGRTCLLARKRYLPRKVEQKGQLEALGVQRASTFRNDVEYREGRQFRKTRDRRAVERMSSYGKRLLQSRWTGHEHDVIETLWQAGMTVPYPVSYADEVLTLQFLGDEDGAAPQLAGARLDQDGLADAAEQLVSGLETMVAAGWVHGDLSAYNLLWWRDTLWFIDFPQALDLAANPQGLNYLHRDVENVSQWFDRRGHQLDGEELFARLLTVATGW